MVNSGCENAGSGYPGFQVDNAGPLLPTPATLRKVAWAKLSSIEFFSTSLAGESFAFAPWLTTLINYGPVMRFVGVYRSDPIDDIGERETTPEDARWLCVRRSEWDQKADWDAVSEAENFSEHLGFGDQIADTFTFATTYEWARLTDATTGVLSELARGFTISACALREHPWHYVSVEVADEEFFPTFDYAPNLMRCEVLESVLPSWLELADIDVNQGTVTPDGQIHLGVKESARELVNAPIRTSLGGLLVEGTRY